MPSAPPGPGGDGEPIGPWEPGAVTPVTPLAQAAVSEELQAWVPRGKNGNAPPAVALEAVMARARGGPIRPAGRHRGRPIKDPFVRWLDGDRLLRGLTHAAYAHLLGISASHWANVRANERSFSALQVQSICQRIEGAGAAYHALLLQYHPAAGA